MIHTALGRIRSELERARTTNDLNVKLLREACEFSQIFTDRCHHGKEEGCLYPCLEKLGMSRQEGILQVMLEEHEMGRNSTRRITQLLDLHENGAPRTEELLAECQSYLDLMEGHILKEEKMLFPTSENILSAGDDQGNLDCYERKRDEAGRSEVERVRNRLGSNESLNC